MVTTQHSRIFASGHATTLYVTIPSQIVNDSQFPFEADDEVTITIDGDRLLISRESSEGSTG
jgi:antitoxin component of MazEF toxin-antitoxin module